MAMNFPDDVRKFVDATVWTFAKTYAATWPHEYVVQNTENAPMILALARHIFEHGTDGRFYSQIRKYHHEGGKVYWSMAQTPEGAHPYKSLRRIRDLRGTPRSRHPSDTIIPTLLRLDTAGDLSLACERHVLTYSSDLFPATDRR